ncbi:Ig-like domain-containing protein [Pyxidicoccus sp. 3LG]
MRAPASSLFAPPSRIGCLLALTLAVACTRDAPAPVASVAPTPAVPETQTSRPESAPFDVGAVIRQVHFAFRPDKEAWSGGHSTYMVRSGAEGLTLTPYHHLRDSKSEPRPGVAHKASAPASTLEGAPLMLGTPRLMRGERRLGTDPAKGQLEQDGHLALARGDVTEHLRNDEDGVEQSWAFERAPAGSGDLLVEIPVAGLTYRGVTGTGLHFADASTDLGFRYGHATWVDARGQRTSLEARFSEGRIQLRVPAGVLDGSAYPAVLDPVIAPESGMDTPVLGPQLKDQTAPVVSALGSSWLVVWIDSHGSSYPHVTGTRVSSSGQVMDPLGINLSRANRYQSAVTVSASSTEWLVAWEDSASGGITDIYGARVNLSGQVMDPSGIAIATNTGSQLTPAVASSGSGWFVVWSEDANTTSLIYGIRVSSAGQLVGSPVRAGSATGWRYYPDVAFNGTNYLVVWQDYSSTLGYEIHGARVSSAGALLDAVALTLCTMDGDQQRPAVAASGDTWFVVWEDRRSFSNAGDIYGTRVWGTGSVADRNGFSITGASGLQSYPAVAARNQGWFVVWEDARNGIPDIYGAGVFSNGTQSVSTPIAVSSGARAEYQPSVSFAGGDLLVVWYEAHGSLDVHGARVTASDVLRDNPSLLLGTSPNDQYAPALARNGAVYLVVWRDNRAGEADIHGARVTSQGLVLDTSGIALCTERGEQDNPVVASNGTDWMVAWDDNRLDANYEDLYGMRLSRTGVYLSGWSITQLSSAMLRPALASDGTDWYVVWEDGRNILGTGAWDIFGAQLTGSGTVSPTTGTNLTSGNTGLQLDPAIAFNGTEYLVAWTDYRSNVTNGYDIYATRVSRTGTVTPLGGSVLNSATGHQLAPAVASAGTEWFVVWEDGRTGLDIYGTRVASTGAVQTPAGQAIVTTAIAQSKPTVASDGTNYFVAWEEQTTSTNRDIHGARVSGAGSLLDAPFAIASTPENELLPAAAISAPSEFLLVYQRFDPAATSLAERIRARRITFNRAPVAPTRTLTTAEDTFAFITLAATDADNDALTFAVVTPPGQGTLSGTPPNLRYTPSPNYHGPDSFTYRATDTSGESSAPATVSVTVTPVNDPPTGVPVTIQLNEDSVVNLPPLQGSDPENDAITISVQALPAHGTLTGTPASLQYTPAPDYQGDDSFTFIVTDASGAVSAPVRVPITISPTNDVPVAHPQSAELNQDTSVDLVLQGSDVDGDALTFHIARSPAHGSLSGTAPNVRYTPAAGYRGPDDFAFRVQDAQDASASVTVSLTVKAANRTPVALAQSLTTAEDTARTLTLSGGDPDGDTLSYVVVTPPAHGTLSGTPPDLTFTPNANFHGEDAFTFQVADPAGATSAPATVAVTVTPENDAPVALTLAVNTDEDAPLSITLAGSDVDGDALTFTVTTPPEHGTLSGTPPDLTYTSNADFHGEDTFTFQVADPSGATSGPTPVVVTVTPVDDAPVAQPLTAQLDEDQGADLVLEGQDAEGDAFDYAVRTQPQHGTLTGTPPNLRYTPAPDFHGADSFTFIVSTASGTESAPATVSLTVSPVNDAPVATAQSRETDEDTDVSLTLTGTDVDGQDLTFAVATQPEHGTLTGTPPDLTYTPAADFHGTDSFTFTASDGVATSTATVSLTVRPVNDVPLALDQTLQVEPEPTALTLAGTDADGDALTFAIHTQPEQGTLTGTPPEVTFTPAEGFQGTATFTFTVSDGLATSAPATVSLRVGNSAPVVAFTTQTQRPYEGEAVRFQTTAADANGDALTFTWDFGDGATSEEASPAHAYANEGTYEAVLTVTDGIATVRQSVVLEVQNAAPVLVPVEAPAQAEEGQTLTFHAQASDSGERDTLTFTWDFGDGSAPATGPEATHTYADSGTYTVKVTVTDDVGAFTQSAREVQVANLPPVPEPVPAQTARGGDALSLQLAAMDVAGERDPLTWRLVEGPGAVTPEGLYTWQTEASTDGHFPVRVRVTDDDGGEADLVLDVTVTARRRPVIPPPETVGCGCASGQGGAASSVALLFLMAVLISRRKRA